jgi:ABC-type multidrug transport system fused ATPase/permease subunit
MLFGDLVAFFTYIEMFFRPIRNMVEKFDLLQSAQAGLERVYTVLSDTDHLEKDGGEHGIDFKESIRFCNVDFSYNEGEKVLKNVDFEIKKGEKVAFVGHTGAGKTTIINLITRFYDIDSGCIRIDGKNIYDLDLDELRGNIAYVPQDVFVFSDTVSYNMALNSRPSVERLEEIIHNVEMKTFIDKLPDGLESVMLERGNSLSFGEKQLLAFSRALYSDPEIIVLDEATSNIDSNTEVLIQNAIEHLLEGKTALIIAHRLSTIKNCDKIFVLKDGEIVEYGNHEELLRNKGYYHKLYKLQYEQT